MEIVESCYRSGEMLNACSTSGAFHSMITGFSLICNLWDHKGIAEVGFIASVERLGERAGEHEKLAWNMSVTSIQVFHLNCPIRLIPLLR